MLYNSIISMNKEIPIECGHNKSVKLNSCLVLNKISLTHVWFQK